MDKKGCKSVQQLDGLYYDASTCSEEEKRQIAMFRFAKVADPKGHEVIQKYVKAIRKETEDKKN